MAKVTLLFAVLLIVLGLAGFLGTGSQHPTALIPAWVGLAMGVFGLLAISQSERRRKLFMHINVTIGLVAYLGIMVEIVRNMAMSNDLNTVALVAKTSMAWLLLIYVILCVRSFRAARRAGKV